MWPTAVAARAAGADVGAAMETVELGYAVLIVVVALAAITGSYEGTIALSEKVAPASYRLTADGQGRPGFVKGSAAIALRGEGATTVVDVQGTVQAGGPVARVGQRLISSVSKMMMDRFFGCLQSKVETQAV